MFCLVQSIQETSLLDTWLCCSKIEFNDIPTIKQAHCLVRCKYKQAKYHKWCTINHGKINTWHMFDKIWPIHWIVRSLCRLISDVNKIKGIGIPTKIRTSCTLPCSQASTPWLPSVAHSHLWTPSFWQLASLWWSALGTPSQWRLCSSPGTKLPQSGIASMMCMVSGQHCSPPVH